MPSSGATRGRTFAHAAQPRAFACEMLVEPVEPGARARTAQREVERAHRVEPAEPLVALAADQRMLEQRQQRHRRKFLGRSRRDPEQQGARGRLRQRPAGAVVGLDAPALEQAPKPAAQASGRA